MPEQILKPRQPPLISVLPIECIKPHEKYDPRILKGITNSLEIDGTLHDPLLVTADSLTIMDGTHRHRALTDLGCRSVPVALYDYFSDDIGIGCWYRCVETAPEFRPMPSGARLISKGEALDMVKLREALVSILYSDHAFTVTGDFDIFEAYGLLSRLEHGISGSCSISFASENDALEMLNSGSIGAVIASPPIKKEEVIEAAITGKLFPIKSTRHVINSRPLGLDIPLKWLYGSHQEADGLLHRLLSHGRFRSLPPCSSIDGRKYEEEVYIFETETF